LLIILTFIGSVQDFQTVLIMTRGGPGMATYVPALRMYNEAFVYGHFGYGAAIGLLLFVLVLAITVVNMKIFKEEAS
jgi:raffinose/stachyose/melibiose transport system permease protein